MRVLVTGATHQPGAYLVQRLLEDPAVEHVLAVASEPGPVGLPVDGGRLTYHPTDLTRARSVHDLLFGPARELRIDAVVHAPLPRDPSEHGARVHATDVESTRELLAQCQRHPTVRRFVLHSSVFVYALRQTEPNLIEEDHPLEFDPSAPQWVRDRVECDLIACARAGRSPLAIAVLRCAEVLAPSTHSQLWDYLQSRVCLRPLGFDPMINVLSLPDCVEAMHRAVAAPVQGVFNIPGADTLPLSRIIAWSGRRDVPVPGPLLAPLYRLRAWAIGFEFRYDLNMRRFHFGGVLDGGHAADELGYHPAYPIVWPVVPAARAHPSAQPQETT